MALKRLNVESVVEGGVVAIAPLIDITVVAGDLDIVLGVLAVVAVAVSTLNGLVAGARGLPLVETLGGPVNVRVAGAVLVVAIAASGVVGEGGGIAGLSLPLVKALGGPVGVGVAGAVLAVAVAASGVVGKSGSVAVGGPLVETLGGPVSVRVASGVAVASGVV